MERIYNAHRSAKDPRDFGVASFLASRKVSAAPPSFDLQPWCGPVRDQGDEGSCTGHMGYAMRSLLLKKYEPARPFVNLSPQAIYTLARQMDGTFPGDEGSTGRTIVRVLNKFGVPPETDDPYSDATLDKSLSAQALADAAKYKAGAYHALTNIQDMKLCIFSGYGFGVGFAVYDSFESDATTKSGLMPVPDKTRERALGGHEVFFMGYNDAVQCPGANVSGAFKVQNSWSTAWGQDGFFWFPYECVADSDVFYDAFMQHLGRPW